MAASSDLSWLYSTLGYTLAALALLLLYWSLFHDRARGRRRCPRCWYDMAGVPGLTCPECGREQRSERPFHRTRRRWRWAALALIPLMGAHLLHNVARIRREGALGAVPTSVLIIATPVGDSSWEFAHSADWRVLDPPKGSLLEGTLKRLKSEDVWQWQSQVFLDRLFRAHPGEIEHTVRLPAAWPSGVPLRVTLNPMYAERYCRDEPRVRVRLRGSAASGASRTDPGSLNIRDFALVGTPPSGTASAQIEVELLDGELIRWKGTLSGTVPIRGTLKDYLRPAPSAAVDDQIKKLHPRLWMDRDGGATLLVNDPDTLSERPNGIDCTLALSFEVLRNGEPVGSSSMSFQNLSVFYFMSRMFSPVSSTPVAWSHPPVSLGKDGARWELRIRPDASLAMQDYIPPDPARATHYNMNVANRYWDGDLTLPLVTCGPDADPLNPWTR